VQLDYLALDRGDDMAELAPRRRQRAKPSPVAVLALQTPLQTPPAPRPEDAIAHHKAQALAKLGARECSCYNLAHLPIAEARAVCSECGIATRGDSGKLLKKTELLLEACPTCVTVDAVEAAVGGSQLRQGVPDEYWRWEAGVAPYSLLSAFHLAMTRTAQEPANLAFSIDVNDFRAHLLRMMRVNFVFYVIEGKVNRGDGPGQLHAAQPALRVANFMASCTAALNHYDDLHDRQTCGRLRKNQACVAFRYFNQCPQPVRLLVRHYVMQVIDCVTRAPAGAPIDLPYHDQDLLRQRFGL